MDDVLNDHISQNDIEKYEEMYNKAIDDKNITDQIQFNYAWSLICSQHSTDISKGIVFLNELCNKNVNDRRDYMYFLAVGYARMKNYNKAKELLDLMLRKEPTNNQVIQLKKRINGLVNREKKEIAAQVGIGTVLVGALVGIGMALAKK